jgi:PAS domain-containing protein
MQEAYDFRDLVENAPCGYIVTDSRGCIVLVNETLATWLNRESGPRLHRQHSGHQHQTVFTRWLIYRIMIC